MKFYIISLILNIMLLFIPIAMPTIQKNTEKEVKTVKVKLNIPEIISEDRDTEIISDFNSESAPVREERKNEKIKEERKNRIKEPVKEESEKKISDREKKTENILTPNKNTNKAAGTPAASHPRADEVSSSLNTSISAASSLESGNKKNSESAQGNENGIKKSSGRASGENVCREGVDYTVSYNPTLPYPIAAQRAGISAETVVNVKLNFTGNGRVSVISVTGGHPAFHGDARAAASKIRVTIKNPETLKCTITKPFRFRRG